MAIYRTYFEWREARQTRFVDVNQLDKVMNGFWVTTIGGDAHQPMKYTQGDNAQYWIPPGRIIHVEKIYVN